MRDAGAPRVGSPWPAAPRPVMTHPGETVAPVADRSRHGGCADSRGPPAPTAPAGSDEDHRLADRGGASDPSPGAHTPGPDGLGRDGRRPGRVLVLPPPDRDPGVQLRPTGRPARHLEGRLTALPAARVVAALHPPAIPRLLRLARDAAA